MTFACAAEESSCGLSGFIPAPRSESADIVERLLANPMFANVPREQLVRLATNAVFERLAPRTKLHSAGTPVGEWVVLVEGVIRVYQTDNQGRQVTVKHLNSPNSCFEMELLTGTPSFGSAETLNVCELVRIPAQDFLGLVDSNDEFCRAVLHEVCNRLSVATRHSRGVLYDVECRLASLLLAYAEIFGRPVDGGVRINLKLTQDDLASGIGVVVRSVSRTLATWKKQGLVSIRKGWYVLHDIDALEQATRGFRFNINHQTELLGRAVVEQNI